MRRLVLLLPLFAWPALVYAQASQFGLRGLGIPGREQSARAMGSAGALSLFDGESSLNVATLGYLSRPTAVFTALGDFRSSTSPAGEATLRDPRFPQFLVGGPIPGAPVFVGLSYSNYTNRDFSLAFPTTIVLQGQPVNVVDTLDSRGGLNDLRVGVAYRPFNRLVVGVGGHVITGTNRFQVKRVFSDTLYQTAIQRSELSYAGVGFSVGVLAQPLSQLTVSAFARSDGHVGLDRDSLPVRDIDLPITVGGGLRVALTSSLAVAGHTIYRNWSTSAADLVALGGPGAQNTFEAAGGIELSPNPRRPLRLPLRLGFRYAKLPFPVVAGEEASEYGIAAGTGFSFAADRAAVALSVERTRRSQTDDRYSETAWLVGVGVTVRP